MGFLLSGGSRVNDGSPVATTLRVQSSVNGLPLGFVHGQSRIAGNLIWYGNFSSTSGSGKGGGKGGTISSGGKGGAGSGTTYSASFMLGLCEGPIDQIVRLWNNKTPQSLGSVGFTEFNGYQGQTPWGYLTSTYPGYALSYSYLAYTAVANLGLGNSPELPNFNWEVRGAIANAVTEQTIISSPYSFTASYFSLCDSITEQVIIPSAPYQYQAQNYTASNAMPVILGEIASASIVGSISSGVVDLNGTPFTKVTTPSATHQYSVSSSGLYTFYSGDQGLEVQIIDLAISPGVRYIYNTAGTATAGNAVLTGITPSAQIAAGQLVTGPGVAPGAVVITASGSTVTLSTPATSSGSGTYTFWGARLTQVLGTSGVLPAVGTFVASAVFGSLGQLQVPWNNFPSNIQVGQNISGPAIPSGTTITGITIGLFESYWIVFLSHNATTTTTNQAYSFGGGVQIFTLAAGTYSLSVTGSAYGKYQFSSADNGRAVGIIDVVDADPSQSLTDFLTNPRYGCGFPAQYLGSLTLLQQYAYSNGLFISPALVQTQAANSYLKDFSTALNGEFVWSSGILTFVPYGDTASTGNGKSYTPPVAAIYSLDDDDFLKNEGTASVGVSAFTSDDPVVCARKRQSDAYNDVKVEFLDRGNSYNPSIVEAKDDAAINTFGLRPGDTKQLHMFCIEAAALQSAHLQLGRQQIRNQYTFTVPWYYILLDPMDVVEITDVNLGLANQWVRILEITENQQDGTLTVSAEEYLTGSGSTPQYGTQVKAGYAPNYNVDPGLPVAPIVFEAPVQLASNSGLEIWLATGGGANFGGCDVWVSTDDETYKWVSRYEGGSRVGQVASDFPSHTDPDVSDTLAVTLSTAGELFSGSQSDADLGHTLCYVGGYAYPPVPQLSYVAGGSLPEMTYYVRQTYLYPGGEGPPSPETSIAVPAGNLLVISAPPTQPNATSYNNYVGVNSDTETLQNSSPLAFGVAWTEPSTGIIIGTSPPPSETGFELVSYETATFVSGSLYNLGTYIRRGQYGTTISDHPLGSQFARLDGTQVMFPYDKSQIGQTIYIKLLPLNLWGGSEYTLDEVQPFPHVIEGPPLPGIVTGFSVSQSNNVTAFAWQDLNDVALEGYDLLYSPQGAGIGNATYISNALRGTESTTASVPPGAWTFYIRGRDIAGQLGPVTTFNFTVTNQNTVVATQVNAPAWISALNINFLKNHWGLLIPDSNVGANALTNAQLFTQFVPSPFPDTFWGAGLIDIGFNDTVRVWMRVQAAVRSDAPAGSAPQNNFALVAWQNGQPEPPSYSNWTTGYIDCEYIFGGYNQNNSNVAAYVYGFNINVDKATVVETGTATIAPGGTAITFPTPFHDTPIVSCTVIGGTSLAATAASPGTMGFTAHVFNPATGADVGGTINYSATGV